MARYRRRKPRKKAVVAEAIMTSGFCFALAAYMKINDVGESLVKYLVAIAMLWLIPLIAMYGMKQYRRYKYLHSKLYEIDKMDGVAFEEFLKAHFEKLGYHVKLTPKSNDYGIDLICKKIIPKKGEKNSFVVQAKRYKGTVGIAAVQQVIGGMKYYDCEYGMVITNNFFTANAKELARKSNVELWDRKQLEKVFNL